MPDTDWLLDLIQHDAELLVRCGVGGQAAATILRSITELRRRGDTLVQRDDLRNVISYVEISTSGQYASVQFGECVERLKNALRGDTFPTGRENT